MQSWLFLFSEILMLVSSLKIKLEFSLISISLYYLIISSNSFSNEIFSISSSVSLSMQQLSLSEFSFYRGSTSSSLKGNYLSLSNSQPLKSICLFSQLRLVPLYTKQFSRLVFEPIFTFFPITLSLISTFLPIQTLSRIIEFWMLEFLETQTQWPIKELLSICELISILAILEIILLKLESWQL